MPSVSIMIILSDRKELLKWQIHPIIRNLSLCEFFYSLAIEEFFEKSSEKKIENETLIYVSSKKYSEKTEFQHCFWLSKKKPKFPSVRWPK
ncbi:hypothetical protein RhiirA5_440427 [Rhizophagus irregularis]|uniref:Uncharacterized protein n=1 Tax=Rhizophagus irregularis TaxID=588596 RepID=A0A2N0NGP1_9GLOM|nr:hypothetical protein RhiirA5_440427 [Rhizophagus irregularis]